MSGAADVSATLGTAVVLFGSLATAWTVEAVRRVRRDRARTTRDREIAAAMVRHPAGSRR